MKKYMIALLGSTFLISFAHVQALKATYCTPENGAYVPSTARFASMYGVNNEIGARRAQGAFCKSFK
jgi:hypothetical protein